MRPPLVLLLLLAAGVGFFSCRSRPAAKPQPPCREEVPIHYQEVALFAADTRNLPPCPPRVPPDVLARYGLDGGIRLGWDAGTVPLFPKGSADASL